MKVPCVTPVHCALSFYYRLASLLFVIDYSTIFVVRSVRMNIQTRPWRILGYRWHDYLSKNLVLSEADCDKSPSS